MEKIITTTAKLTQQLQRKITMNINSSSVDKLSHSVKEAVKQQKQLIGTTDRLNQRLKRKMTLNVDHTSVRRMHQAMKDIVALQARANKPQIRAGSKDAGVEGGGEGEKEGEGDGEGKSKKESKGLMELAGKLLTIDNLKKGIDFMNWSDGIAATNTRLSMANDGQRTQLQLQQQVMQAANGTRQSYQDTAGMVTQLSTSTQGIFSNNNETISFVTRFNELLGTGGATAEESKSAIEQMVAALSGGALQGDALDSLIKTAPLLPQVLANGLGMSQESMRQLAEEGKLTSEKIVAAFSQQGSFLDGAFANAPVSFSQATTVAKNKAAEWVSQLNGVNGPLQMVNQAILELIGWLDTDQGKQLMDGLSMGVSVVAQGIAFLIEGVLWLGNAFMSFMPNVVPLFVTLLAIIGAVIVAIQIWSMVQAVLNLVMDANPILLIILLIVGLVAAFLAVIATLQPVREFMANTFHFLGQVMSDTVGWLIDMWTGFINGFIDGVNVLLSGVNDVINAIGSFLGIKSSVKLHIDNIDSSKFKAGVQKGIKATFDATANGIENFDADKIKQKIGFDNLGKTAELKDKRKDIPTINPMVPSQPAGGGNINRVNEVGKIGGSVEVSSEDLKTMRELAEMKNIQNFVTLTPTVNVKTGNINNEADFDSIITKITTHLEGEIGASAEGVYNG